MAMLVLPDVIARTWGERPGPPTAAPPSMTPSGRTPWRACAGSGTDFVFMAEAYWDLEWTLQQQGFDYTYDKRLYDRLLHQEAGAVRGHLRAAPEYQRRSARFLENHDEPRAAAVFPPVVHDAAAVITLLLPGLRFLHEGQRTGRRLRAGNHLRRRAPEPIDRERESFYGRLLTVLRRPEVRDGQWALLEPRPAWDGNPTSERFIAFAWDGAGGRLLAVVNFGPTHAQCYVRLAFGDLSGRSILLTDLMHPTIRYERQGDAVTGTGLYLDLPPWGHHVFAVTVQSR